MSDIAIRAEKLSKKYSLGVAKVRHNTLRDHLVAGIKSLFKKEQRSLPRCEHFLGTQSLFSRNQEG